MSGRGEKNFSVVPSELRLTQKWDFAVENFITRPAVGLAVAGLISVVLFRNRGPRIAFSTFGMGVGFGDAYRVSTYEFEREKALANTAATHAHHTHHHNKHPVHQEHTHSVKLDSATQSSE